MIGSGGEFLASFVLLPDNVLVRVLHDLDEASI